jgi:uncharacterized lipoprotein YajG
MGPSRENHLKISTVLPKVFLKIVVRPRKQDTEVKQYINLRADI